VDDALQKATFGRIANRTGHLVFTPDESTNDREYKLMRHAFDTIRQLLPARAVARAISALTATMVVLATPAAALEVPADEKEKLKTCEKNLCQMILTKSSDGDDLTCQLSKTWASEKISEGAEQKSISWDFGDARCGLDLSLARANVIDSLTKPEHTLEVPEQTVKCEIEREGEITPINVSLAPKLTFKAGKAQKAWLNVSTIEAPTVVKGAIWTAAKLEDNFGLFHSDMIEEINDFMHVECAKRYPEFAGK